MSGQRTPEECIVYCSFCGRDNHDFYVKVIIDAGTSTICSVCTTIAAGMLKDYIHAEWLRLKDHAP